MNTDDVLLLLLIIFGTMIMSALLVWLGFNLGRISTDRSVADLSDFNPLRHYNADYEDAEDIINEQANG